MNEALDRIEVVVAGHICLDITPNFGDRAPECIDRILSPGKLTKVAGIGISTGGAVANTGLALSRLGIRTQLMGKIGDDPFGGMVLGVLRQNGDLLGIPTVTGARTSYSIVLAPPGTDRIFLHDPGANDTFGYDDIDFSIVAKARLFHLGYPPMMRRLYADDGAELIRIFKEAKELGVTTSLDMCMPDLNSESGGVDWDELLQHLLPYVDIFLPSIEEILFMLDRDSYLRLAEGSYGRDFVEALDMTLLPQLAKKLMNYGVKIVVLKCGKRGCYLRTSSPTSLRRMGVGAPADPEEWAERELFQESFHVHKVVSATGAGDTCISGFLAAMLGGVDSKRALRVACATGADCVGTMDVTSGVRPIDETLRLLDEGWETNPSDVQTDYWNLDLNNRIWLGYNDRKWRTKR